MCSPLVDRNQRLECHITLRQARCEKILANNSNKAADDVQTSIDTLTPASIGHINGL